MERQILMKQKKNYSEEGKTRFKKGRLWYENFMSKCSCQQCGIDNPDVLEWHHQDPNQKDNSISNMIGRYSVAAILSEIQKCICLCANCHRILHVREKGKLIKKKLPRVVLDV